MRLHEDMGHDREMFSNPAKWNEHPLHDSPLFSNMEGIWRNSLSNICTNELSSLAYRRIPPEEEVLHNIKSMVKRIKDCGII